MENRAKGRYWGLAKLGAKGQIVIPKNVRDLFKLAPGDSVMMLADKERGIAILPPHLAEKLAGAMLNKTLGNEDPAPIDPKEQTVGKRD